jgi:hypothetical protein
MTTYAGQILADPRPGPTWVPCNGATYHPRALHHAGTFAPYNPMDYVRRAGWWAGIVGFGDFRVRVPLCPGYWVALCDNPDEPDLLPDNPTVIRPPPGAR